MFYVNYETKSTTWERPVAPPAAVTPGVVHDAEQPLPPGKVFPWYYKRIVVVRENEAWSSSLRPRLPQDTDAADKIKKRGCTDFF